MDTFDLCVYSADKPFYEGECVSLVIPVSDGQYGIQAHHMNMISAVVTGEMTFTAPDGAVWVAAVSNGLVKVEDNSVLILVDTAERPDEIDKNRAERDAAEAKEAILQKRTIIEYRDAHAKLARALNRLKVKGRQ